MLVTPEFARTMTCPMTFSVPEVRSKDGRGLRESGPWMCVGSTCMAWRWHMGTGTSKIEAIRDRRAATGDDLKSAKEFVEANSHLWGDRREGYCGMAGRVAHD